MDEVKIAEHIALDIAPIIHILLVGIVALMMKDFLSSIAKGLRFCWCGTFREGDKVKVDGMMPLS